MKTAEEIMEEIQTVNEKMDENWMKTTQIKEDNRDKIREAISQLRKTMEEQLDDASRPALYDLQEERKAIHERKRELLKQYQEVASDDREGDLYVNYENCSAGWYSNRVRFTYWKVQLIKSGEDTDDLSLPDRYQRYPKAGDLIFRRHNAKGQPLKSWEPFVDVDTLEGERAKYSGWAKVDSFPRQIEFKPTMCATETIEGMLEKAAG